MGRYIASVGDRGGTQRSSQVAGKSALAAPACASLALAVALASSPENSLTGQLAISYAKGTTIRGATHAPLASIDPLKLVAGIGWRKREDRFGGQLIMTHSSQKAARDAATNAYRPAGFTILDATAFVKPIVGLTLRAGLFNITDAKYAWWSDVRGVSRVAATLSATGFVDPPVADAYTQSGRNVSVSASYSF